jgi:hypothetical protein
MFSSFFFGSPLNTFLEELHRCFLVTTNVQLIGTNLTTMTILAVRVHFVFELHRVIPVG